jgi:hypothetical protein
MSGEPYDWACEPDKHCPYCTPRMDQRDVDLEYRKVWATEWPDDYPTQLPQRTRMTGRIVFKPPLSHVCLPPEQNLEVRLPVGTLWECDCGAVWQVHDDVKPQGWVNRRDWVRLGRIQAWWVRRHHTGWTYKELST